MAKDREAREDAVPEKEDGGLTEEERSSLTHGGFRLDPDKREIYRVALQALRDRDVPFVVSGLYALHQHTGLYRRTKDLDLMLRPGDVLHAARVLKDADFHLELVGPHWLAKAVRDEGWIDLVFGMANGLHFVDDGWIDHAHPGELAGVPVQVAAPEDLIFHRLFIWERHRSDMADIAHLVLQLGPRLDWDRLLHRVGDHWRLLLAQLLFFDFLYPGKSGRIPDPVRRELLARATSALDVDAGDSRVCQGTLISRFSFAIDVNEWGFTDYRQQAVEAACTLPIVDEIRSSDVWDELRMHTAESGLEPPSPPDTSPTAPAPWGAPGEWEEREDG